MAAPRRTTGPAALQEEPKETFFCDDADQKQRGVGESGCFENGDNDDYGDNGDDDDNDDDDDDDDDSDNGNDNDKDESTNP